MSKSYSRKIDCNSFCSLCFVCLFAVFHRKSPIGHHLHMCICSSNSIIFRRHNRWCISKCATRCTVATDIRHLFIRSTKRVPYEMVTYSNGREHKMRKFINMTVARCVFLSLVFHAIILCCCTAFRAQVTWLRPCVSNIIRFWALYCYSFALWLMRVFCFSPTD